MAPIELHADQTSRFEDVGNSYGNTVVQDGAHAHLGDVSQDVNIQGDLHLHFHTPLDIISLADEVVGLIQVIDRLCVLGIKIQAISDENERNKEDIRLGLVNGKSVELDELLQLHDTLATVLSRLSHLENTANSWSCQPSGKPLQVLVLDIVRDIRSIVHLLGPLYVHSIEDEDPSLNLGDDQESSSDIRSGQNTLSEAQQQSRIPSAQPFSGSTEANDAAAATSLIQQKVASRVAKKRGIEQKLNQLKFDFLNIWIRENLRDRFNAVIRIRQVLNEHLYTTFNPRISDLERSSIDSDIVEVLSINRPAVTGTQNIAAILTRANGRAETIAIENLAKDRTNIYDGNNLVKYELTKAPQPSSNSRESFVERSPNFAHHVKEALYFDEEDNRRAEVEDAHKRTFNWIFQQDSESSNPQFRSWLEDGQCCYWINGKAGSGKSTLMKYIYQHPSLSKLLSTWSGSKQLAIITFFFWHAGQPLQKSHEGVLRSLLRQVLDKRPSLTPIIFPRFSRFFLRHGESKYLKISSTDLKDAVMLLKSNMPEDLALFLMIDGVDEYSGDHFDFCKLLTNLAGSNLIKVLVSSRPLPACHQIFSRCPGLRLQDLTAGDIRAYIGEELLKDELFIEMDQIEPGFAKEVSEALTEKSSGVFLWIVLVVRRLLIALGNYDDRIALMAKIDELPTDLEKLYDHMLGGMTEEYRREGSLLIQLVVYARDVQNSPLSALQLFMANQGQHAIKLSDEGVSYKSEIESLYVKAVDGKLRSRCCGLIEVQYASGRRTLREAKVDFFHRTVYDYLRELQVWTKITSLHNLPATNAYLNLLASCVHVLLRRNLIRITSAPVLPSLVEAFTACLSYSNRLEHLGHKDYVDLLELADAIYQDICEKAARTSSYSMYERACELFALHHEVELPDANIIVGQEVPRGTQQLLMLSRFGFPSFLEHKLEGCAYDPSIKGLILLGLLYTFVSDRSSVFSQSRIRSIALLLNNGACQNTPVMKIRPQYTVEILCEAALLFAHDGKDIIPWNFWIAYCSHIHLYPACVQITLLLLKAGAHVDRHNDGQARVIESLVNKFEIYTEQCADEKLRSMCENVLSLLKHSNNDYNARKRKR